MNARSFFDTNVLLYADDQSAPAKQRRSPALMAEHRRSGTGIICLQVLQEYFVNLTRKLRVDPRIARRKVEMLAELDVAAPDVGDILAAIGSIGFLFWDALNLRRPNNPAAAFCSPKIFKTPAKSMGFKS